MYDIKQISIEDDNYPKSLKKISGTPKILYYQGVFLKDSEICFAVVGTRNPTDYGKRVALQIVAELADMGLTIISGMAPGIDTLAHKVCVEKNKRTIAVLGTGLDEKSIYPRENLGLAKKIIETGGCLISELPVGTPGSVFSFPKRNRIVSGLSLGALIVEAKEKSGSLITADYAKKQGKKVFAVPGQIFTANAKGTNGLIKEGAVLTESAEDILKELKIQSLPTKSSENFVNITPQEKLILLAIHEESLYIDKIIEATKLPAHIVGSTLALLEISGKIRNLGGGVYGLNP